MKLINDNPGNKILVFCLNISQCRSISERCKRAGISSIISHSAIETDTRLGSYFERKFDEKVLICNEIIATSFEVHADLLIFFNTPEHLESLAHITGIVCQSGKPVKSIFLLNEYYSQFLHLLQPGQEWSSISALFKSKMIINSFGV
jgi:superfamily II DNA/RNA helicase